MKLFKITNKDDSYNGWVIASRIEHNLEYDDVYEIYDSNNRHIGSIRDVVIEEQK